MQGLAIRIGIIAVIVIGGAFLSQYFMGAASDLKVGDCFDLPDMSSVTVEEVQRHPCSDDHQAEVFFVGDYPGSNSDPLPADEEFVTFIEQNCFPAFETYTGVAYIEHPDLDLNAFWPLAEGWSEGDHEVTCFLFRVDEGQFKGSMKVGS